MSKIEENFNNKLEYEKLTGVEKVAIFIMALGVDKATKVIERFSYEDAELISKQIIKLGKVPSDITQRVLDEFLDRLSRVDLEVEGGVEFAKKILEKFLGSAKANKIVQSWVSGEGEGVEFKELTSTIEKIDTTQLVKLLDGEHPQIIAVILSMLPSDKAAIVLSQLNPDIQVNIITRIVNLERPNEEILESFGAILASKFKYIKQSGRVGGIEAVVEILKEAGRSTEKHILENLAQISPEIAEKIRDSMFTFDDIALLDDRAIQRILREVDTKDLALALKGVPDTLKEVFFRNLSKRASLMLKEDMEAMGAVPLADVESAQKKIVNIVRTLEEAGEIVTGASGGEMVV